MDDFFFFFFQSHPVLFPFLFVFQSMVKMAFGQFFYFFIFLLQYLNLPQGNIIYFQCNNQFL